MSYANGDANDNTEKGEEDGKNEDQIISNIGNWGRWQAKYFLILCVVALPSGFPSLSITFLSADTDFWCTTPGSLQPIEPERWRNLSSPLITEGGKDIRDQCNVWNNTQTFTRPSDNSTR